MANSDLRQLYPLLGRLLTYPDKGFPSLVEQASQNPFGLPPDLAVDFEEFRRRTRELSLKELQELYTRFFDLSPLCIPYLSVHLFGEENLKRSRLMVALREKYQDWGFDPGSELPDHLSTVLRAAPHFEEADWKEFVEYCVIPSLEKIRKSVEESENPYRLLIEWLWSLTHTETLLEISHA